MRAASLAASCWTRDGRDTEQRVRAASSSAASAAPRCSLRSYAPFCRIFPWRPPQKRQKSRECMAHTQRMDECMATGFPSCAAAPLDCCCAMQRLHGTVAALVKEQPGVGSVVTAVAEDPQRDALTTTLPSSSSFSFSFSLILFGFVFLFAFVSFSLS